MIHFASDWKKKGVREEGKGESSSSAISRVEKATSELLVAPDWSLNMEICDCVNYNKWLVKDVVKAVKKRFQHGNNRVHFLALTLLETMIKNCGELVHFQVADCDILQELVKIVRKKTDRQVVDKILVLLDSWQEAFGGPRGKYPQYYLAYAELKNSGVEFPQRSRKEAPIFTPPVTHTTRKHSSGRHGKPRSSSVRFDEAIVTEMGNLSLSDLVSIRRVMELLNDMLQAVNPKASEAVKDEVIVDLVRQCRANQNKIMHLVSSTGDEELLSLGLTLNDKLRSLIAKYEAIDSGSPLPLEVSESVSVPSASSDTAKNNTTKVSKDIEEDEDDGFSQLARRNTPLTSPTESSGDSKKSEASPATRADAPSFPSSNVIALNGHPTSISTVADQNMIDLLSMTVPKSSSQSSTPVTPPIASTGPQPHLFPNSQNYPYVPPISMNQGSPLYTNYVTPWAVPAIPQPAHQPLPQQDSSRYPPPPWAVETSSNSVNPSSNGHQSQTTDISSRSLQRRNSFESGANNSSASRPMQKHNSFGARGNSSLTTFTGTPQNAGMRPAEYSTGQNSYVLPYRLFDDLVELRTSDGEIKTKVSSSVVPGSSNPSMIGGRK